MLGGGIRRSYSINILFKSLNLNFSDNDDGVGMVIMDYHEISHSLSLEDSL